MNQPITIVASNGPPLHACRDEMVEIFPGSSETIMDCSNETRPWTIAAGFDSVHELIQLSRGVYQNRNLPFDNRLLEEMCQLAVNLGLRENHFIKLKWALKDRRLIEVAERYNLVDVQTAIVFYEGWIGRSDEMLEEEAKMMHWMYNDRQKDFSVYLFM